VLPLPTIHASSFSDAFDVDADSYEYVNAHRVLGQFTRDNRRAGTYRHEPQDGEGAFRFVYLWPSTFLVQDDCVEFPGAIVPTGPESYRYVTDVYTHPDCDDEAADQWLAMWTAR
jgi:hypothetical protein